MATSRELEVATMRLNPLALALAFGVARVFVTIFTVLTMGAMPWVTSGGTVGSAPFVGFHLMLEWRFLLFQIVFGFLGAAIGGALAAVIYNGVIARKAPG